ncbi:hypothetical protein J5N58_01250 [Rhizobium cremeum]|uniref:hypothetical protein n=1 Tax=Rhizobium cremeum TaxID=2813827 RepID=UPI000DDC48E6|nr:hypothetical protein [Rhizobium cremeum]MCJ7993223.1 hypothetical protein [Rhizobium cremeum]MCJ7998288.1 hypothetical protein [Rhizobium cremeum]
MGRLRVVSPAGYVDCLTCAGARGLARKASIWMRSRGETLAIFAGDELLAVAYLVPDEEGRLEFCLSLRREARAHILALCRFAHRTLREIANHGAVVFCRVYEGNRTGAQMARLVGFRPDTGINWLLRGDDDDGSGERPVRRRGQYGLEGGSEEPAAAAGGE